MDAFEGVAAVDVPSYIFFFTGIAAAGPADLFEAAEGFGGEDIGVVGAGVLLLLEAYGSEVRVRDGEGEAGVCFLEVGGETELDGVEERISVDDMKRCVDVIRAFLEDLDGGWGLRG